MGSKAASPEKRLWEADADVTRPLMDHSFLHAGLKQALCLPGHHRMAEIIALPLAAPVALKEVELRTGTP